MIKERKINKLCIVYNIIVCYYNCVMSKLDFNLKDAVSRRYSMRTFTSKKVSAETRQKILDYADKLSNPFGPKIRIKFIEKQTSAEGEKLGTYGIIKNAKLFLGVAVKNLPGAQEGLGYEFEQLVLYMTSLGLGTCWIGGTFDRGAFAEAMKPEVDEIFTIICPVGYGTGKKRFFEKIMRLNLKADSRLPWNKLFFKGDFENPLSAGDCPDYEEALEFLRQAPSAVNKQPWRVVFDEKARAFHFFENHSMAGAGGAVDIQLVDMGIGMNHFHLAAEEKGLKGHFEEVQPDVKLPENTDYITSWVME